MVIPYNYVLHARFSDTDLYGVVHHSNYLKWAEEARISLMEEILAISLFDLEQEQIRFPVINIEGKYIKPVKAREEITISLLLYYNQTSKLKFVYRILNSKQEVVFKGMTEHVALAGQQMLLKLPKQFEAAILESSRLLEGRYIVIC